MSSDDEPVMLLTSNAVIRAKGLIITHKGGRDNSIKWQREV
jgi:hypothetical protein